MRMTKMASLKGRHILSRFSLTPKEGEFFLTPMIIFEIPILLSKSTCKIA